MKKIGKANLRFGFFRWKFRLRLLMTIAAYITVPAIVIGGFSLSFHLGKLDCGLFRRVVESENFCVRKGSVIDSDFVQHSDEGALWSIRIESDTELTVQMLHDTTFRG